MNWRALSRAAWAANAGIEDLGTIHVERPDGAAERRNLLASLVAYGHYEHWKSPVRRRLGLQGSVDGAVRSMTGIVLPDLSRASHARRPL